MGPWGVVEKVWPPVGPLQGKGAAERDKVTFKTHRGQDLPMAITLRPPATHTHPSRLCFRVSALPVIGLGSEGASPTLWGMWWFR